MRKIKLGIIGCGHATNNLHWPALKQLKNYFEIKAVCSKTRSKAKHFAAVAGCVPYTLDYKELLKRDDVEAVTISVPIILNSRIVEQALKAGKHVFAEKPIAANMQQAKTMIKFPNRFQRVMMIAENSRYRPLYRRAKELMDGGLIGMPYATIWNILINLANSKILVKDSWRRYPKHVGGFITDGGVHNIAALRLLFGEIRSGCAWSQSINDSLGKPDIFSFQFKTDRNIKGVLNLFFSVNGINELKLLIMGTKGTMLIEGDNITLKRTGHRDKLVKIADKGGFREEFLAFYNQICRNEYTSDSFIEAYTDLSVILGALQSTTGRFRHL